MNPHELKKKFKKQMEYNEYFCKKEEYFTKKRAYKKVIDYRVEEYAVSTDRVVKALRFDVKDEKFLAMVKYIDLSDHAQENVIHAMNEWVLDSYGETLMKMLVDRAENKQFLLPPTDAQGTPATIKINNDKVV